MSRGLREAHEVVVGREALDVAVCQRDRDAACAVRHDVDEAPLGPRLPRVLVASPKGPPASMSARLLLQTPAAVCGAALETSGQSRHAWEVPAANQTPNELLIGM